MYVWDGAPYIGPRLNRVMGVHKWIREAQIVPNGIFQTNTDALKIYWRRRHLWQRHCTINVGDSTSNCHPLFPKRFSRLIPHQATRKNATTTQENKSQWVPGSRIRVGFANRTHVELFVLFEAVHLVKFHKKHSYYQVYITSVFFIFFFAKCITLLFIIE